MALVALLCEARVVGELETLRFLGTTSTRSGEKPAGDLKFSEAGRCERSETDGVARVALLSSAAVELVFFSASAWRFISTMPLDP